MKNKKLMFSEARFVFMSPLGDIPKLSVDIPDDILGETAAQKAKRLKMERGITKKLSAMKLNIVKDALALRKLDLRGKIFDISLEKADSKSISGALLAEVLPVLEFKANESLLRQIQGTFKIFKIEMKLEDVKLMTASVYAKMLLDKAKLGQYSRLSEYAKAMNIKDMDAWARLSSDASGEIKVEYKSKDPNLFKKYKKWELANAPKAKAKAKQKEVISKQELDRFAKSPLGKIFKLFKGGKDGKKNWLELMQEGKAPPFALFIAGLFGYKIGADMYNGAVDFLPEKFKGRMKSFERKARASRLSAKSYAKKNPRKTAVVGKGAEPVNAKYFADAIKYNSIPKKGVRLSEDYSLKKGETLDVDLTGGGQVVLPKGKDKAYVNGELADLGKVYKNVKITFSNTIPKGTVMTGKVDFKRVAPKKTA